jgi:hypothetical protein
VEGAVEGRTDGRIKIDGWIEMIILISADENAGDLIVDGRGSAQDTLGAQDLGDSVGMKLLVHVESCASTESGGKILHACDDVSGKQRGGLTAWRFQMCRCEGGGLAAAAAAAVVDSLLNTMVAISAVG